MPFTATLLPEYGSANLAHTRLAFFLSEAIVDAVFIQHRATWRHVRMSIILLLIDA